VRVKELFAFIRERHAIYERRAAGEPKPWTEDPILRAYRFCNVYRELDKVTVWIRENWREPNAKDPDLFFAMVVARLLNKPESLAELDYVLPWDKVRFKKILRKRKERGEKIFSAAYMIHADAEEGWLKTDYLAEQVLTPMWKEREDLRPRKGDTLSQFHSRLMTQRDMGSFMAGQVIADTKFAEPLKSAADWWTWAAPGPGSLKGMNYVLGLPSSTKHPAGIWERSLKVLQTKIDPLAREAGLPRISAQDLQNCLCEFSKYERARLGEGRPKQLYDGIG
jgi:hypothetical protein